MLSQDLASLAPGGARPPCFLTREGRVLADLVVWRLADRLRLVLDADAAGKALPALERYVIADDVAFDDATASWALLLLFGDGAPAALSAAGIAVHAAGSFAEVRLGGQDALLLRRDLGAIPAFEVLVPARGASAAHDALAALEGVAPGGETDVDAARVTAGVAAWGAEVDERTMPNEAGLEDALSWTKGCYLGQEPVVMARHRGHPPSLLVRLSFTGDVPARGTALLSDGRPVGRVTTAGRGAALALVRHDLAKAGAALSLERAAGTATVAAVLAR